jgi:hypothetical protein
MQKYKLFIMLAGLLLLLPLVLVSAITVDATAPKLDTGIPAVDEYFNDLIQSILDDLVAEANKELEIFGNQSSLAQGFADANTHVSQVATQRAMQGYELFAVSLGTLAGFQFPAIDKAGFRQAFDEFAQTGDIYMGIAWQAWALQVGINAGFLLEDLYLSGKLGFFEFSYDTDPSKEAQGTFKFDAYNVGLLASYHLIKGMDLIPILFNWRGVFFSSGLILQSNSTSFNMTIDTIESDPFIFDPGYGFPIIDGTLELDPSFKVGVKTAAITLPLEIYTGLQILYLLETTIGLGLDLNLGGSDVILVGIGETNITGDLEEWQGDPGVVTIDASTLGGHPTFVRPRICANLGINLGPVKLDVPMAYHFNYGFSIGATVGFAW